MDGSGVHSVCPEAIAISGLLSAARTSLTGESCLAVWAIAVSRDCKVASPGITPAKEVEVAIKAIAPKPIMFMRFIWFV